MTRDRIDAFLSSYRSKRLLVIGDLMLDRFIWGNVSRISPEAPVPVVHVQRESAYPGGAANVARNLTPFTPHVSLMGLIGTDDYGAHLVQLLAAEGIDTNGIVRDSLTETIVKTRVVARHQQVCRVDRESPMSLSATQIDGMMERLESRAEEIDAIILEDYGKGLLHQPIIEGIVSLANRHGIVVTADPNPNNKLSWDKVTVLKPNRLEAFRMAGLPEPAPAPNPLEDLPLLEVGRLLLERWDMAMLLITLGEHGMLLFDRSGTPRHVPARHREVFDVSGAGDTAVALLTLTLAAGGSALEAVQISNLASGVVVGKLGTATLTPTELRESIPA
ncbi:MAG: D-glycero-beta-D-manno-heptose-7-phosphate kinase [Verrucomicrobia bacterium]|nr:D-glycero-beta-D-manno-heptose-7-phosphate kinase [Verrucomicrobiota bacterium]